MDETSAKVPLCASSSEAPPRDEACASGKACEDEGTHAVAHADHTPRRGRWSAEEQRVFWQAKRQAQRERRKAAAASRRATLQAEWERLTVAEQQRRREEAVAKHARRHAAEAALHATCEANWSRVTLPTLVFDLSFAWCMTEADTRSTVAQIKYSYSALRHAGFPLRPVITSTMGKEADDAQHDATMQGAVLAGLKSYAGFHAHPPTITHDVHWSALYPRDKVVYLTADAEDVLREVAEEMVYVVGAFVDHNRYKGLTHAAAVAHGVRTARLPLQESIVLGNRCKVLTINHVVEVLTRYMTSAQHDWSVALEQTLPTRRLKEHDGTQHTSSAGKHARSSSGVDDSSSASCSSR